MRGDLVWLCAAVVALGACAGRSESHGKDDDVGASGSAAGGASGSATGGASGSPTGGASGSATGGVSGASGTGGIPDMTRCEQVGDCALVPRTTCCICGVPELENVTAVNAREAAEYSRRLCAMSPPCQCASGPNPNLVATCEGGTCVAIDIRDHAVSACSDDADCRVRSTDCCECGANTGAENLIAVGPRPGYEDLVCSPMTLCPECEPAYPPEISARCNEGNCALVVALP